MRTENIFSIIQLQAHANISESLYLHMVWHETESFLILCFVVESAKCEPKVKAGLIHGYELM